MANQKFATISGEINSFRCICQHTMQDGASRCFFGEAESIQPVGPCKQAAPTFHNLARKHKKEQRIRDIYKNSTLIHSSHPAKHWGPWTYCYLHLQEIGLFTNGISPTEPPWDGSGCRLSFALQDFFLSLQDQPACALGGGGQLSHQQTAPY